MKLEKSRETLQSAALSRVRMFLKADLDWLPGFPFALKDHAVEWAVVPREDGHAVEKVTLTRDHLRKAGYSYNRLVRHFPRALPRAVKDIRAWKRGVPLILDLLKPSLQANKPLSTSLPNVESLFPPGAAQMGREIRRRHPYLGRFLDALEYILCLTPEDLSPSLRWTSLHAPELRNILAAGPDDAGLSSLVSLWELTRRLRYRDAEFLLKIIGDERTRSYPTHGWTSHLNGLRTAILESTTNFFRTPLPAAPRPILADRLLGFVTESLRQPQDVRNREIELLELALDTDFLSPWAAAWRRLEATPSVRQHIPRGLSSVSLQGEIGRVEARIKALLRDSPPEVHIETLLEDIRTLAAPSRASCFPAVRRALRTLPPLHNGVLARAAFLHDWADADKLTGPGFAEALLRLSRHLAAGGESAARLKPWENVLRTWTEGPGWSWSLLEDILSDPGGPAAIESCFQALEKASVANPEGLNFAEASRLVAVAKAVKDADLALNNARDLAKEKVAGSHLDGNLVRAAHALRSGPGEFGRVFKTLDDLDLRSAELESILQLDRDLQAAGWEDLVREELLAGEGPALLAISARRNALKSLGGACAPPENGPMEDLPGWIGQYPREFAGALAALARLEPNAEQKAGRIFGQDFISPGALREEIESLERRIRILPEGPGLSKRLAALRSRLSSSAPLPPGRLLRLEKRLLGRIRRDVVRSWYRWLDEALLFHLKKTLDVTAVPPALADPALSPLLAAIMNLSHPYRKIGIELLRRRCGPRPWNLHDHPANLAFLERIRKKGIDPDPWIRPRTVGFAGKEGEERLQLGFAEDPLEIFRMGAYFQTCLSPDGVNFYSVISNAADINKRVLFARDEAGRVAGRCLFALSDQGGILTFHPYCHDSSLGFPRVVACFASDLAARMKTAVVARGRVERLIAPKWYDDGPRDTGVRFAYLDEKSIFRARLGSMRPDEVLEAVTEAVGPLSLNALTLPAILMLPELEDKPELVIPLLTPLEKGGDVPAEIWLRAADLARQAERPDRARRIFLNRIAPYLAREMKIGNLDDKALDLGLALDPSAVLRLFRQTRPRRVKSDDEEPPDRRAFIARAHEALGRENRARRLRSR